MKQKELSPRLAEILESLPLTSGMRILEIGCGPGSLARAMAERIGDGHVHGVDRSAKAITQATELGKELITSGHLSFREASAETLSLADGEAPFDIAVAIRVGALDGRHPEAGKIAREKIKAMLLPGGTLLIDGGDPLRRVPLDN